MTTMVSQITSLTVVYSTVYSDADQRKHQSSASLAFVRGIHLDRWIPHTKGQLRGKCFHLMTSSCIFFRSQIGDFLRGRCQELLECQKVPFTPCSWKQSYPGFCVLLKTITPKENCALLKASCAINHMIVNGMKTKFMCFVTISDCKHFFDKQEITQAELYEYVGNLIKPVHASHGDIFGDNYNFAMNHRKPYLQWTRDLKPLVTCRQMSCFYVQYADTTYSVIWQWNLRSS